MLHSWKALAAASVSLLLAGCASFGPFGTPDFEPTLRRDLPGVEGKLIHQAPAALLHAIDGYGFVDNIAVESPLFAKERFAVGDGLLVLTERKIHFVKWTTEKYRQYWDADYDRILSVEVRSFGAGRRLVMKVRRDAPTDAPLPVSFDITQLGSAFIDVPGTIAACQLIAQRAGKGCTLPQ